MRSTICLSLGLLLAGHPQVGVSQEIQEVAGTKSVQSAYILGVGATLLGPVWVEGPAGLGIGFLLVGPGAGLLYAESYGRGLLGIGLRTASLATLISAYDDEESVANTKLILGSAVLLGSYIWDFISIKSAVRSHNRRLTITPTADRGGRVGLQVRVKWPG